MANQEAMDLPQPLPTDMQPLVSMPALGYLQGGTTQARRRQRPLAVGVASASLAIGWLRTSATSGVPRYAFVQINVHFQKDCVLLPFP